jgi:F-type H+-transporting ATPase subunit alpha
MPSDGRDSWIRRYELEDIGRYEKELLAYMKSDHADILEEIESTQKLEDDVAAKLAAALDAFGEAFVPSTGSAATGEEAA